MSDVKDLDQSRTKSPRRLRQLGTALDWRLNRLQTEYLNGSSTARAELAKLRRGLGKPAGTVPAIWDVTIAAVPESLRGDEWSGDFEPSAAEQAAHAALTLFAMHQQSASSPMHMPTVSFGRAVGALAQRDERSSEAVARRFMAVATAQSIDEVLTHVRGLVSQMRAVKICFDYARFAEDIADLLVPARALRVRLSWGRDFYRNPTTTDTESKE